MDVELTYEGVEQAHIAGEAIKASGIQFDAIVSSPLMRTVHTAQIVADAISYPRESIAQDADLMERYLGDYQGTPTGSLMGKTQEELESQGVESFESLSTRTKDVIAMVKNSYTSGENVLLVSHAAYGRMLRTVLVGNPPETMYETEPIANARLIKLV